MLSLNYLYRECTPSVHHLKVHIYQHHQHHHWYNLHNYMTPLLHKYYCYYMSSQYMSDQQAYKPFLINRSTVIEHMYLRHIYFVLNSTLILQDNRHQLG